MQYRLDRVEVGEPEVLAATWAFARKGVRGTEFRYPVTDGNHRSRNKWVFAVRVPDDNNGRIEVRPLQTPNDRTFAGLERRSLTFMRGGRGYTRYRYCPLALAVPNGSASRDLVHRRQKLQLPSWLRRLGWRLKQKATVRSTKGTDGESLVVLVQPRDHAEMIRLFMATKAWVLKRRIALD
jgi:hypothetical protein